MRPAHFVRQPAHNRHSENNRGKVLRGVKMVPPFPLLRRERAATMRLLPGKEG